MSLRDNIWLCRWCFLPPRGAIFSDCGKYRYKLWRTWDDTLPFLYFILMNPSKADEVDNDPTVERQVRRAKLLGYGGLVVLNCGAIRETDSKKAWSDEDPVGPLNTETIREEIEANPDGIFIAGWGKPASRFGADIAVIELFNHAEHELYCLGVNKDGSPKHPLYIGYDVQPVIYKER